VRNERKWSAYVKNLDQGSGSTYKRAEVVNLVDDPNTRPIGHKKAKNERYGKKKAPEAYSTVSQKARQVP
jgi:hypothetical protein